MAIAAAVPEFRWPAHGRIISAFKIGRNDGINIAVAAASGDAEIVTASEWAKATQIAAALCGHDDQSGYATLVEKITGHKLPKFNQRADWAARPLAPALAPTTPEAAAVADDKEDDAGMSG